MIIRINRTEEIRNRLQKEGKSRYLSSPSDIQGMIRMNEELRGLRRDFITKSKRSEISAAQTILNA